MGKLNRDIDIKKIIHLLLIVAILIQAGFLLYKYRKDIPQIVKDSVQHGLWRSAKFAQGVWIAIDQQIPIFD